MEKSELVARVNLLSETERQERERTDAYRTQEELEEQWRREERELERQRVREEQERRAREAREREQAQWREDHRTTVEEINDEDRNGRTTPLRNSEEYIMRPSTPPSPGTVQLDSGTTASEPPPKPAEPASTKARPAPPPPVGERSGICVICTDDEANIVIVDCG